MGFEFATATRIIFGRGKFDAVGEYASGFGNRVFIVNGTHHGIDRALQEVFEEKKINFQFLISIASLQSKSCNLELN